MAHYLAVPIRTRRASIAPISSNVSRSDLRRLSLFQEDIEDSNSDDEKEDSRDDEKEDSRNDEKEDSHVSRTVADKWRALVSKTKGLKRFKPTEKNVWVNLNIGGKIFRTTEKTLKRVPNSKLSLLTTEDSKHYDKETNEYFFDRNPKMFTWILDYYRRRELHVPRNVCVRLIQDELSYWGLDEDCLADCCKRYYLDSSDEITTYEILQREFQELPKKVYGVVSDKTIDPDRQTSWREKTWTFLDESDSSFAAKVWAFIYLVMILLSILSLFIATLPSCRVEMDGGLFHTHDATDSQNLTLLEESALCNNSISRKECLEQVIKNPKLKILLTTQPHIVLLYVDFICKLFFSIEFIIRFIVCPRRLKLLKNFWTFLDMMYLLPVWLLFVIDLADNHFWYDPNRIPGLLTLRACMVFRVMRIFRFVRHYRGLRLLYLALRASVAELFLLFVFVTFAITIYGSIIYCAEIYNENSYDSIFIGLWWALITMTTVGYGDFYPETWAGYIVACFCAFTGIITIGMPVAIIASNFHAYYGLRIPEETTQENTKKRVKPMPKPKASTKMAGKLI